MILPWDKLVKLALAGYDDLLDEFLRELRGIERYPDPARMVASELGTFEEQLAALIADLGMSSAINGMADPIGSLTIRNVPILKSWRAEHYAELERYPRINLWDGIAFPSETPAWRPVTERAVESLRSWNVVKREEFDKLGRNEASRAWTITGVNSRKSIASIRETLGKAIESGASRVQWYQTAKPAFDKSRLGPAAAELVFRVAATKAWHEGQARIIQNPVIGQLLPYVKVHTINDTRRRVACTMMSRNGLNGTSIYNRNDPAYIHSRTPRGFNCRCRDSFITVAQAARNGVHEAIEWQNTGKQPTKFEMVPYFEVPMPKGWIPLSMGVAA